MKQAAIILSLFIIFTSCKNKQTENSNTVAQITSASVSENITQEEKDLIDIVNQHPDSLLLKENLIQYYREKNNYEKAIATTQSYLNKDSLNDRLWDIKATLYFENSDTVHAIKSFEKAIGLSPKPEYIMSLGSLYAQTKNPLALTMADALLKTSKSSAQSQAIFIEGLYYSYSGDKNKALDFFNQCISLNFTNMLAYREKAICLYDLGKYNDALNVLQKAVTLQNTFDEGYFWMGKCFEKINQTDKAVEAYKMALQISNDYPEAQDALARLGVK